MLADLAERDSSINETFAEAGGVLGYDLWRLTQEGPAEELNRTEVTQPAMLAAGVGCWRAWLRAGGAWPAVMAGHSLGEYTALVCAEALAFGDAVSLVRDRGRFMQEAVPDGGGLMAAVMGLEDVDVQACCDQASSGQVVAPVNFNAPGQVVIAGHADAVRRAMDAARDMGAKRAQELPVSVPSHSPLMRPAAERMADRLHNVAIEQAAVPVIHNTDAAQSKEPASIREHLVAQLHQPVRWVETVGAMRSAGARRLIELGPGKILAGLNRRIDRRFPIAPVHDGETLQAALEQ